jgi:hypothetical protein
LFVLTADHGVAFGDRQPIRGVSRRNYPQILWVPMMVKAPGQQQGVVDDRPARTVDLLPTIAGHLGARLPWRVDGRSLLGPPAPDGPRQVLDWEYNAVGAGRDGFAEVPGPPGFALVRAGRAWDAPPGVSDRLYRVGPYGTLLGQTVSSLERQRRAGTPGARATLDDPDRFARVEPGARRVPWTYVTGTVDGVDGGVPLAITANGVVAGLTGTYQDPLDPDRVAFWAMAAPDRFRRGRNDVAAWRIDGPPDRPTLARVRMTNR